MSKFFSARFVFLLSLLAFLFSIVNAPVQAQSRITEPVDDKIVTVLPHTTHPFALSTNDRGRVDSNLPMQRMILLFKANEKQQAALKGLIDSQHDKESPSYQKWLTPEQFAAGYGPSDDELKQVKAWLGQQGFQVEGVARGRQWLEFSGSAGKVERALHTEIHHYAVNGQTHVANASDISLPRALTPVIAGVVTLHDFRKHPLHGTSYNVHRDAASGKLTPDITVPTNNGNLHFLTPGDYAKIYDTESLLKNGINGSGMSIAIVGRTDIQLSDVQTFRQIFGLPANDPHFIVNGQDPGVNGDELEADLDVEWSGSVAPNATIDFVSSASTFATDGVDLSISYIVDNVVAPIMSTSYGQCEAFLGPTENAFYNIMYQQAAAEGITALVSSGDNGPAGCDYPYSYTPAQYGANVNGLASTPYNLAVGGTEFNENGHDNLYWNLTNNSDLSSARGYIPEAVWNESCDPTVDPARCGTGMYSLFAGSGGPSNCSYSTVSNYQVTCIGGYSKPSWQTGTGVPKDSVRDLPDLAMAAAGGHDGYLVCIEGSCQTAVVNGHTVLQNAAVVGGTSAAAPSMAGMMALVEQQNGSNQGLANYNLYKLAASEQLSACNSSKLTNPTKATACIFHDITAGSNSVPGQQGYNASVGYDMATGLGSVDAANLVAKWPNAPKIATGAALSLGTTTIQHGHPIKVDVLVSPLVGTGLPSGGFSLTTKYGSVLGGTLTNGSFSGGISDLPGGKYNLAAHYPGDAMFKASDSNAVPVQIAPEPSRLSVAAWVINLAGIPVPIYGTINYGQPLALQYTVAGVSGKGSATGNVTITLDGTVKLGTFPLDQKGTGWVPVDTLQSTGLVPGYHTYVVTYHGDNSFYPSTSANISVNVRRVWPESFISPVPASITVGAPMKLLLTVRGPGLAIPTGTVQLYDNGRIFGNAIVLQSSGPQGQGLAQAIAAPSLPVGTHQLQISYSGDSNYDPVSISNFNARSAFVTVNAAVGTLPSVRISQSPLSPILGQSVTYTVNVSSTKAQNALPTGTVNLVEENGAVLAGPVSLSNGVASFVVPWNFAATSAISAAYSGDANYSPFSSAVIFTTVKPGTPKVTLTPASSTVAANALTSLTVSVVGAPANPNLSLPYGQVMFLDAVNGSMPHPLGAPQYLTQGNGGNPIFTLQTTLPAGSNVITVHYLGSSDWREAMSNAVAVEVQ